MGKNNYQRPSEAELKKFGLTFSGLLAFVFGVLIPLIRYWSSSAPLYSSFEHWPVWPWVVAGTLVFWALAHPASLFLLHRPWMRFAVIAGWVNTRFIMLILFCFMIMPMGLLMRLFRYDPMRRKLDKNLDTYRVLSKRRERDHMKVPY